MVPIIVKREGVRRVPEIWEEVGDRRLFLYVEKRMVFPLGLR